MSLSNLKLNFALIGEKGAGKSAWIRRLCTGSFEKIGDFNDINPKKLEIFCVKKLIAALGVEAEIDIGVIDPVRGDKSERREFLKKAVVAVILVDVTNKDARRNVQKYIDEVKGLNNDAPILVVYNKVDLINYDGPLVNKGDDHVRIFSSMLTGLSSGFILTLPVRLYLFRRAKDAVLPNIAIASFVKRFAFGQENCNDSLLGFDSKGFF